MQASLWLVVSAVASVLLGIVFLQLFKHQPQLMTKATIASQVLPLSQRRPCMPLLKNFCKARCSLCPASAHSEQDLSPSYSLSVGAPANNSSNGKMERPS